MNVRRTGMALALVGLVAAPAVAQGTRWSEAWVGSETEIYLRALALNGMIEGEPWSLRPFSPATLEKWSRDSLGAHPWKAHLGAAPGQGITLLRPSLSTSYNSAFPWGFNDGAVWQGKGANVWGTAGVEGRWGVLTVRLEPVAFLAQNASFPLLVPETGPGPNPFVDPMRPGSIDLPQRFGNSSYARVDPGQSYVRLDAFGATAGASTENLFWGPAVRNPLLLGPNAAGFPHVFIGTSHALATPVGRWNGQVVYGRLSQSDYGTDAQDAGTRFGTGFILVWMPPAGRGLELGVARFFHRDWPARFGFAELKAPFEKLFGDPQVAGTGPVDNQLLSGFARVSSERAGAELFVEFGKNDRNSGVRDATLEPEHNSAWSAGFLKTVGSVHSPAFWTIRGEYLDGRVTSLQRFRGQSSFYDHNIITEGHTEFGQLLGSPLLERTQGLELSADRWSTEGRLGVVLTQRAMPADLQEGQPSGAARSQWSLEFNATRFRGGLDLTARAGVVFDLNRTPGNDVSNLFAGFAVR